MKSNTIQVRGNTYRTFEDLMRWKDIELVNIEQIENGDIQTLDKLLPRICSLPLEDAGFLCVIGSGQ